jgi:hypothetical protein
MTFSCTDLDVRCCRQPCNPGNGAAEQCALNCVTAPHDSIRDGGVLCGLHVRLRSRAHMLCIRMVYHPAFVE